MVISLRKLDIKAKKNLVKVDSRKLIRYRSKKLSPNLSLKKRKALRPVEIKEDLLLVLSIIKDSLD